MWATGVVMHLMLTGRLPFRGVDEKSLYKKIQSGNYGEVIRSDGDKISTEAKGLMRKLMSVQ